MKETTTDLTLGGLNCGEDIGVLRAHLEALRVQCVLDREEGLGPIATAHVDHALALIACTVAQLDLAIFSARQRA